jgi:predicted nucleic acid-binding protein
VRVAADANVLLSALLGHAALRAIDEGKVEPVTTLETLKEVAEYLPLLAKKYGIDPKTLEANFIAVGVTSYGPRKYRSKLVEAKRRIAPRDPDDVPLLALALALRLPIWTSDRDFEGAGVVTYTTAELLARLGIRPK